MLRRYKNIGSIVLGILILLSGTIFAIYDWGRGDGASMGGYYYPVYLFLTYLGPFIIIKQKLKDKNTALAYAFIYPIVLFLLLVVYSKLIIEPSIEKRGLVCRGIVVGQFVKLRGNMNPNPAIRYEYFVDGKKYIKSAFNDSLRTGDSIQIRYLDWNPHFHRWFYIKK